MSLVELLVATAVVMIAVIVLLAIYDRSRRSFKRGENAAEQQQSVRVAFDRITSDLRMAGFNFNPDGDADTPDEQIEGAFAGAIAFRGDYDRSPEPALAGTAQAAVAVGNDEIVMYALSKPSWSGGQTLRIDADVRDVPRDGAVETVSVGNVAVTQAAADAPYTLYRMTLNPSTATWGGASFLQRTPLIENVRSLLFRYFDDTGAEIDAATLGGGDTDAARDARRRIRRIQFTITGLTRESDLGWIDPADPDPATRSFRKFELSGVVAPRNLGMRGMRG